jgi:hypothetical protein
MLHFTLAERMYSADGVDDHTQHRHRMCPSVACESYGRGKSMVCNIFYVLNAGISLTITTPLLSIGADQEERDNAKSTTMFCTIVVVHLDEIWAKYEQELIIKDNLWQLSMWNTTTFLFSSPERRCSLWMRFLEALILIRTIYTWYLLIRFICLFI